MANFYNKNSINTLFLCMLFILGSFTLLIKSSNEFLKEKKDLKEISQIYNNQNGNMQISTSKNVADLEKKNLFLTKLLKTPINTKMRILS